MMAQSEEDQKQTRENLLKGLADLEDQLDNDGPYALGAEFTLVRKLHHFCIFYVMPNICIEWFSPLSFVRVSLHTSNYLLLRLMLLSIPSSTVFALFATTAALSYRNLCLALRYVACS